MKKKQSKNPEKSQFLENEKQEYFKKIISGEINLSGLEGKILSSLRTLLQQQKILREDISEKKKIISEGEAILLELHGRIVGFKDILLKEEEERRKNG